MAAKSTGLYGADSLGGRGLSLTLSDANYPHKGTFVARS